MKPISNILMSSSGFTQIKCFFNVEELIFMLYSILSEKIFLLVAICWLVGNCWLDGIDIFCLVSMCRWHSMGSFLVDQFFTFTLSLYLIRSPCSNLSVYLYNWFGNLYFNSWRRSWMIGSGSSQVPSKSSTMCYILTATLFFSIFEWIVAAWYLIVNKKIV